MARPETTPTRRGSQDKLETPPSEDDFESPREPRKASTRRPPLSPTSPNTGRTPAGARTARESTRRLHIVDNDGDDGDCSLPEEESEDQKPNASKGRKRKKPTASKRKGKKKIRHDYRDVDPEYADMTTERLFNERHISTGKFSYNHPLFAMEAAAFNDAKVNGKEVWQKQPSGPSTLHNSIVIADHFTSLAHFLRQLEKLCKPRPTTDRLFLKQRAQQYTKSGRQHRDGKNAPWRMCATVHDPAAPLNIKQLEIGVADASKAKGGRAVNPFQTKADGTTDAVRFNCPSGSYHIMDIVATGLVSHAHHQAIIDKSLLPVHGALTTFVLDLDPINPETFIEDVAEIARGTADEVGAGVGVSAPVPPPTPGQIGQSCGSTQTSDWNKLQQEENAENYLQDRRDAGAAGTLYGREKGGDGRSLSSEQGASIRPADTSAQWTEHAVEEPLRAEPATCSNCEEPRELSWFFYGGGTRRVVVMDHKVGKHRCNKYAIKPRGVFKPTDEKVNTITKDGLRKAVWREAKRVAKKASGGN